MFTPINAAKTLILIMFSFTLDIYCTSVRPGRGIPHMWLSLRFLLSFYLLKGFFFSFSLLLLRVKGRGCHTLFKPYETNCGLWIWAIQIKFDWLIDFCGGRLVSPLGFAVFIIPQTLCCFLVIWLLAFVWHCSVASNRQVHEQECPYSISPFYSSLSSSFFLRSLSN